MKSFFPLGEIRLTIILDVRSCVSVEIMFYGGWGCGAYLIPSLLEFSREDFPLQRILLGCSCLTSEEGGDDDGCDINLVPFSLAV